MKIHNILATTIIAACTLTACNNVAKVDEALTPVSFEKVTLDDNFWLPRLQIQKKTLVPFALQKTETAVENLRRTAAYRKGEKQEKLIPLALYVSSDLFKVMEGAAYLLTLEKDEKLEKQMDEIIDVIADAQADDGYLYEYHQVAEEMRNPANKWGTGDKPYSNVIHSHELYNMGHMYEGAIAYYQATGKRKWLDVAEKSARHINKVFFEGDPAYNNGKPVNQAPGHEELELALIKMYRVTGDTLYLNMAKRFIDIRGVTYIPTGKYGHSAEYAQQHKPVREQRTAIGHAVRAMYLYSGMADVAAIAGDTTLPPTLKAIWHDIVDKKMHITGGLGAVRNIEGFGPDYELPNKDTYNETCAAVGNVLFNYRMFLMSGDAKYVDVAEVSLYNNVLAGVNLEGNKFFYVNPLETDGHKPFNHGRAGRSPWFGTACCPSNLARLIPQISGMIYSHTDDDIFCALYAGSNVEIPLKDGKVKLEQKTDYPFDGKVAIEVTPANENEEFTLWLRIPTWCGDSSFVAGELYSYANKVEGKVTATINGKAVKESAIDGFLPIGRKWKSGDKVELNLPMSMRLSVADERVKADSNRVCITRGPLVYCAEEADNRFPVSQYFIADTEKKETMGTFTEGVMKNIPTMEIEAAAATADEEQIAKLKLIPYYAWNNRGDYQKMNVWFARDAATVRNSATILADPITDVRASFTYTHDSEIAIADGKQPTSSSDTSIPRWTSWPRLGAEQQIDIILKKSMGIESVAIYWYDDNKGVKLPVKWRIEKYSNGEEYSEIKAKEYGTKGNCFNKACCEAPIYADKLRIYATPQKDAAVGILEIVIDELTKEEAEEKFGI